MTMPGGGRVVRQWPTVVLVVALLAVGALVERVTPASLIVPPDRPYQPDGDGAVRTGAAAYPRSATGADEVRMRVDAPPRRIVSQYWSTDEYLYSIVPPERIVGVSEEAYETRISNVYDFVERYRPVVAIDPERVLTAYPDLVLTPDSARSDQPAILRQAGLPVYRIYTNFESFDAIRAHMRLIGYLTGEDERARQAIAAFDDRLARAAAKRPKDAPRPRVLGLGGDYVYGSRTVFDDALRVVGADNVAADNGLVGYERGGDEKVIRWDPDWIIAGADAGTVDAVRAEILAQPSVAVTSAARHGHVVVFDNRVFLPLSPFSAALVEALADALYGGAR